MKYLMLFAASTALAACGGAEPEAPVVDEPVEEVAAVPMAADGLPSAGRYRSTNADGEASEGVFNEDGTYSITRPDGTVETGRWEQPSPDIFCQTTDEEGAGQECYNETIGEDGVWRSTGADGETTIIERIEG